MYIQEIARIAHEVNRAYCESLGDYSLPIWEDAPQWMKDSPINGVQFCIDCPNAGPEATHANWMKKKFEDGWVYGQEKNEHTKQHPNIRTFDSLPQDQQAKDHIFIGVVRALLTCGSISDTRQ